MSPKQAIGAITAQVGLRELAFTVSLGLIWYGLASIYRPAAPLGTGLVLLSLSVASLFGKGGER